MEEKSQRLWALIGILIGFYGNWYFNLMIRLEETHARDVTVLAIWGASAFSLFTYCTEIIHWKQSIIGDRLRLSLILATVHFVTTYAIYLIASLPILYFIGILLWFVIVINEIRMYYARSNSLRFR